MREEGAPIYCWVCLCTVFGPSLMVKALRLEERLNYVAHSGVSADFRL